MDIGRVLYIINCLKLLALHVALYIILLFYCVCSESHVISASRTQCMTNHR